MAKRAKRPDGASSIYFGKDGFWHGRVTVGVCDDGKPDRRHVSSKVSEAEVIKKVRALEKQRDEGKVRKPGRPWTAGAWLLHWVEEIAKPSVRENTYAGYEVAVRVHLIPGVGAHRLDKLERTLLHEDAGQREQSRHGSPGAPHDAHGPQPRASARPRHPERRHPRRTSENRGTRGGAVRDRGSAASPL